MRASRSPGAASRLRYPAIDTVRAVGRDDNCGYWLHTRCAGFHRLLCVVHAGSASGQRGNAASHLPGAQSPGPRSDQLSRASPHEGECSPKEELCVVKEEEEQVQIRSCGSDQDEADVPVPGGGSTPI